MTKSNRKKARRRQRAAIRAQRAERCNAHVPKKQATAIRARAAHGRRRIREQAVVTEKHLAQPYYYARWFQCTHADCKTTLIMPARYVVHPQQRMLWAEEHGEPGRAI